MMRTIILTVFTVLLVCHQRDASAQTEVVLKPSGPFSGGFVSPDGLSARYSGAGAFSVISANKGVRGGRVYFEGRLDSKPGNSADTWTNLGISNIRSRPEFFSIRPCDTSQTKTVCSYPAYEFGATSQILDGDVLSIAIDLRKRRLYFAKNGNWLNGNPEKSTGGRRIARLKRYFAVVTSSAPGEDMPEEDTDTWTMNFGASPFTYVPPTGYASYASKAR
jgi:hypothetical protein